MYAAFSTHTYPQGLYILYLNWLPLINSGRALAAMHCCLVVCMWGVCACARTCECCFHLCWASGYSCVYVEKVSTPPCMCVR